MINRKYSESKFYISPQILIIISVLLVTFSPITIYFYGFPLLIHSIGVFIIWKTNKKLKTKILWTISPIILCLIIFYYFMY